MRSRAARSYRRRMTTSTVQHTSTTATGSAVSRAGALTLAAGVTGALAGAALAVWPREVAPEQFSYPLGPTSHVAFQLFFAVHHLGLLAGLLALGGLARPLTGRATRAGTAVAVVGMVGLTVMEAVVAFVGVGITVDSSRGQLLGSLYGLASVLIGLGLVIAGVGLARRPVLPGSARWLPLVLGVWVFVPMTPALFAPMVWGRLAIIGWMLLFAVLGLQLRRVGGHGAER